MNILLLLSALLSAITGVDLGGSRAPVAAEQVARSSQVAGAVAAFSTVSVRPAQTVNPMTARLAVAPLVRLPTIAIPAFASRRRE